MTRKIFVQLGRAGDILNALPLAHDYHIRTGERPYFMIARAFASILDGVTYVEPVVFDGEFEDIHRAMFQARSITPDVTLCQIYARNLIVKEGTTSFARESWRQAGATAPWGSLPLVLDHRDPVREAALCTRLLGRADGRPVILVATGGHSSPFPYARMILRELRAHFGQMYSVIDLSQVQAERLYDLLGVYDRAHCLVAIDTAHQHLAAASSVPVVALVTRDPSPWHGSPWRPGQVGRFFYDEFPDCIGSFLRKVRHAHRKPPTIIHTWADWREPVGDTKRRMDVAQASWRNEYDTGRWAPLEMKSTTAVRDGRVVGDPHPVPFARDVIEWGVTHAESDDDIIALTNADVGFAPGLTGHIIDHIERRGCAFTHRRDFYKVQQPFVHEGDVRRGNFYPGSDAFFFTVGWWKAHEGEYADYLMGREHWDEVLRQLIKYHGGMGIEYAIWHEWHVSFWCDTQRWTLPGNLHNAELKKRWFADTGFQPEDFRWFKVIEQGHTHP